MLHAELQPRVATPHMVGCHAPDQVLFYCHFPDLLLTQRRSALHGAYRRVLDAVEEASTGQAHQILVNSLFTQGAPHNPARAAAGLPARCGCMLPGLQACYAAFAEPSHVCSVGRACSWQQQLHCMRTSRASCLAI